MKQTGAARPVANIQPSTALDAEAVQIGHLKARDSRAWAALFDSHYDLLCRYAFVRLGSRPDAEDIAAQVFLRALESIHRYDYRGRPILAWLYTIARNLVNQRHRRLSLAPANLGDTDAEAPEADLDLAERIDLVNAVGDLKDQQREVIVLRFALGLSLRETAATLGRTEASVHSLQVRAVEKLRSRLTR